MRVGKTFSLLPASCLHWPLGEKDLIQRWVDEIRSDPNAYTILLGDSFDMARTHYRNHIRSYRDDDNSQEALDDFARQEVAALAKVLTPIKGRIWGVLAGNHMWEFLDGTNSEQYLCQLLKLPYLGALGLIRVTCEWDANRRMGYNLTIFAHHNGGSTGARTTGGDVAGIVRQEPAWDADIYLTGHTHRKLLIRETVLGITPKGSPKVVERNRIFARCGSFLKSFKEDYPSATQAHRPSYAEKRALRPADLGWVRINVRWRENGWSDGKRIPRRIYPEYELVT